MLTLYDYLPSQNGYKIRLLLNQLDRPYRTETVSIFEGEGQRPEYLAINQPAPCRQSGSRMGAYSRNRTRSCSTWLRLAFSARGQLSARQGPAMDVVRSGLHSIHCGLAALLDAHRQAGPPTRRQ